MRARPVSRAVYSPVSAPTTGRYAYHPDALLYAWYGDGDVTELVANAFGSALAGTQYERQPDGSVVSVGTRMAMDYIQALGMRGLRTCGAVQNLLPGDTSQARSVTLTAQAYTLQVFGAGSASCSYGTATVSTPLTFTATAGTTVFTPSGASMWQLTATSYPVPYTPPGTTMTSSSGSATNGAYFSLPQGGAAWAALDGAPDGVELCTNGTFDSGLSTGWSTYNTTKEIQDGKLKVTVTTAGGGHAYYTVPATVGDVFLFSADVNAACNVVLRSLGGSGQSIVSTGITRLSARVTATESSVIFMCFVADVGQSALFDNISIQRIKPKPMTLAWRGVLGVGSADLPAGPVPVIGGTLVYGTPYVYQSSLRAYDNINLVSKALTWSRNDHLILIVQVNTAGTQFRVGYMNLTQGHSTITWSSWTTYDGSFNPDPLYQRLFFAFGNNYPMWTICTALFPRQLADAEIIEAVRL